MPGELQARVEQVMEGLQKTLAGDVAESTAALLAAMQHDSQSAGMVARQLQQQLALAQEVMDRETVMCVTTILCSHLFLQLRRRFKPVPTYLHRKQLPHSVLGTGVGRLC